MIGVVQSICMLVLIFDKSAKKNKIKIMFRGWVTFHLGLFGSGSDCKINFV